MKKHDGTYMCVAENPAGIRKALAAVRVKGQYILKAHSHYMILKGYDTSYHIIGFSQYVKK